MYQLSEQQIDYIFDDISARGVEMESLQQNLLDHICCIIENNLEENGDFESFYQKTIKTFYKDALWEIEEETLLLLTYKNYYTMKKVMILSGLAAAVTFITGSFFKIMHWPGASFFIFIGMITSSLIFLPLFFTFKYKEASDAKNKLLLAIGTVNGILFCVSSLFKIMHWPGAHMLWLLTIGMMVFIFIPVFYFNGVKKPETKTNTIATTIILIIVAGFFFALTSLRQSKQVTISKMYSYLQNEELIKRVLSDKKDSMQTNVEVKQLSEDIQKICYQIKGMIIYDEIGQNNIPSDFETKNIWIEESGLGQEFTPGLEGNNLVVKLKELITKYNSIVENKIPTTNTILRINNQDIHQYSNYNLLNQICQTQLFVLVNENNKP